MQPALEGPGRVAVERAEDAHEDLLGEVLGVVAVTGQAVGQPEDAVGVLLDDLVPRGDVTLRSLGHRGLLGLSGLGTEQCADLPDRTCLS